jgi:hypothetical protein
MTRKTSIEDRNAADAQALAAWLRTQRYLAVRVLPDGSVAALVDLLFTRGIVLGCHWDGWTSRFCFEERELADRRFSDRGRRAAGACRTTVWRKAERHRAAGGGVKQCSTG